jgi:hypothetical protein
MKPIIIWCIWFGFCDTPPPEPPPPVVVAQAPKKVDTVFRGVGTNWEQWRPLVQAYFPEDQVDTAVCIIQHESGGNPWAINPSSATGLFQVKSSIWGGFGNLEDPTTNAVAALYIYQTYGWTAWSAYNRGKC